MKPTYNSYAYISSGIKLNLSSTQGLNKNKTLNQLLNGKYKDKNYSFNLVTKISPERFNTVALTKFGARIFTISYYDNHLDFVPTPLIKATSKIRPEYILADIQLVYWPLDEIRKNLTGDVEILESKNGKGFTRTLSKNGKIFIEISYSTKDKWNSKIRYRHLERKYEYTIENL